MPNVLDWFGIAFLAPNGRLIWFTLITFAMVAIAARGEANWTQDGMPKGSSLPRMNRAGIVKMIPALATFTHEPTVWQILFPDPRCRDPPRPDPERRLTQ